MSRMVSFVVLIVSIVVIGFLFYRVMAPFLLPLFLAALLVVIFHPLHRRITDYCKGRHRVAAAITTLAVLLIVLLPFLLVIIVAAAEGSATIKRLNLSELRERIETTRDRFGFGLLRLDNASEIRAIDSGLKRLLASTETPNVPGWNSTEIAHLADQVDSWQKGQAELSESTVVEFGNLREAITSAEHEALLEKADIAKYRRELHTVDSLFHDLKTERLGGEFRSWIKEVANPTEEQTQQMLGRFLNNTKGWLFAMGGRTTAMFGRTLIGLVIMVVAMFFFLSDGPAMVETAMRLSPLADRYETELLTEFEKVSRAVVVGTLLSAIAQGLLGGVGYYLAGFESVFLLILLTTGLAMVPFVGAAAVWVPACLWLLVFEERMWAAGILAIYGAVFVSSIDNLIKPMILHGQSSLHPLLALLSVLGGVNALGPIGILVGPMVVAFLQTLLNILHRELLQFDSESVQADKDVAV